MERFIVLLFLLFINDLPSGINSMIKLYADDVLMFRGIYSSTDQQMLHKDIDILAQWSAMCQIPFNLTKCEHLRMAGRMLPSICHYTINGHTIQSVKSAKYLGLTLSHNLSWSGYISRVTGKANSVLAFLQRNLYHCPQGLKVKAYLTYVCPIVEYASDVWSPYTQCLIHQMEMILRRAARFVFIDFSRCSSVTSLLSQLNWPSLQLCRDQSSLIMFFKIIHNLVNIIVSYAHLHTPPVVQTSLSTYTPELNYSRILFSLEQ